jgi:hypothetical protein
VHHRVSLSGGARVKEITVMLGHHRVSLSGGTRVKGCEFGCSQPHWTGWVQPAPQHTVYHFYTENQRIQESVDFSV